MGRYRRKWDGKGNDNVVRFGFEKSLITSIRRFWYVTIKGFTVTRTSTELQVALRSRAKGIWIENGTYRLNEDSE